MTGSIKQIISEHKYSLYQKSGIDICHVENKDQGISLARDILNKLCNKQTVLYLSGGTTPGAMYELMANEGVLNIGAAAMIDERYGSKWHDRSNEKMMRESGLLKYFEIRDIPFYPILNTGDKTRPETAAIYDERLRVLQSTFPKHIGILGIGDDGHTAGIPAKSQKSKVKSQNFNEKFNGTDFVAEYDDGGVRYGQRITMTFTGLSMLDLYIILVFGSSKQNAMKEMFEEGDLEQIPARFYLNKNITPKTLIITDQ